jgi:hypothetical protein
MVDLDAHADGVLFGVHILREEILAGPFDVEHHRGRGVDAHRLAHESDRAIPVHDDPLRVRQSSSKIRFHR